MQQVGYISEYPHATGHQPVGQAQPSGQQQGGRLPSEQLFWKGLEEELPEGRRIIGRIWPKVHEGLAMSRGLHHSCNDTVGSLSCCAPASCLHIHNLKSFPSTKQDPATLVRCKQRLFDRYYKEVCRRKC